MRIHFLNLKNGLNQSQYENLTEHTLCCAYYYDVPIYLQSNLTQVRIVYFETVGM